MALKCAMTFPAALPKGETKLHMLTWRARGIATLDVGSQKLLKEQHLHLTVNCVITLWHYEHGKSH